MLFKNFFEKKPKKVVIIQCRLSSTRLPRKALLPLGKKCVLEWTLDAMKMVKADKYYLATDDESSFELENIAKKHGYSVFAGSKNDVLKRFCDVINLSKADVVLRATADNPFLFYEAAQNLLDEFVNRLNISPVDYMTFKGLPHGSGVEVFNAHSLLRAIEMTDDPYDHEHVGPALYNHQDLFKCLFLKAERKFYHPDYRTTIDTFGDYLRAQAVVEYNSQLNPKSEEPYTTSQIVKTLEVDHIKYPILFIPSVSKGHGTGHLRRCLDLALKTKGLIYLPLTSDLEELPALVKDSREKGLLDYQILRELKDLQFFSLIVTDYFQTDDELSQTLFQNAPVLALDEGKDNTDWIEYLLDVIPSTQLFRPANFAENRFISLPQNKRNIEQNSIKNALVVLGGEDPASLSIPATIALAKNNINVTTICSTKEKIKIINEMIPFEIRQFVTLSLPIENLKENLYKYDLVVTHFGFTAFEARSANCNVILLGTTPLHEKLAKDNGFKCVSISDINERMFALLMSKPEELLATPEQIEQKNLDEFLREMSKGVQIQCPICRNKKETPDLVIDRSLKRTYRRCNTCGLIYMSWSVKEKETEYNHAYFFEDYQKQYGKTYLDDFNSIKSQGIRRISNIDMLYRKKRTTITPSVLDIGCAMGPFLDAASTSGWQVFGTDICKEAVEHVQNELKYPAVCGAFPNIDLLKEFGVDSFNAVTMWFVIEHFMNIDEVLRGVSKLLKKGGIFAFSTPSAVGVSGKYNKKEFYKNSPSDHYSIWEPKQAKEILKKYGFEVVKVVPTGIHPERFPVAKRFNWKQKSPHLKALASFSKVFCLGDTFEIYCRKI